MPVSEHPTTEDPAWTETVFSRVVVGVDGTEPGFEACRQAARLADPDAAIDAVAVVHLADAAQTGPNAPRVADQLEREAEAALGEAARILGDRAAMRFVNGFVTEALLREVERAQATVIVLGSHGHRRLTEILIGGVAGEVLHRAPCSVLVARPPQPAARFPRAIVVGNDDSAHADVAVRVAERLAERFGAPLSIVKATGPDHPVHALVRASADADLIVVGSRGLRGLKALGSVSERVAHEALCSVLVVRAPSG